MPRVRRKPWTKDELLKYEDDLVIVSPEKYKGRWKEVFKKDKIHIELGTGKGQFVTTLAEQNKDIGYIGADRVKEVLYETLRKTLSKELDNMKVLWFDVNKIDEAFDEDELDRIYINFCDPWPKRRHRKRRLTHRGFLEKYRKILVKNGEIHLKTDSEILFEFTLNEMLQFGFKLEDISLNLYRDGDPGTIKTEYEEKFIEEGKPIYRLRAINVK
ncbi:tRNA (guanosine(46)-N7)-methyltransferase TrmB [Thermohalobacter berrensis]|uniref:tRNA (guanine-N(7)-)-methyltransferase n=1 Tax=Thermohalobacter berrensis TaxID=99594 RepID=A0A419T3W0_9FIRM|nr:tRNA (guanosine(46)-N7)-methyltransferase TrmB [Thermohalobacter berrensis]RKD32244.1 tRNA (guanosine(46)-N7)-methyltransferase TrmB [Thermohalobacter berrensis]